MWIKFGATFPKVGWYPELHMVIKYIVIIYKVKKHWSAVLNIPTGC